MILYVNLEWLSSQRTGKLLNATKFTNWNARANARGNLNNRVTDRSELFEHSIINPIAMIITRNKIVRSHSLVQARTISLRGVRWMHTSLRVFKLRPVASLIVAKSRSAWTGWFSWGYVLPKSSAQARSLQPSWSDFCEWLMLVWLIWFASGREWWV